jgi:hypothetical protein
MAVVRRRVIQSEEDTEQARLQVDEKVQSLPGKDNVVHQDENTVDKKESVEYPDTPDELFSPEKTYSEAEEDLLKFVEHQVELMNENLLFSGQEIPSFYSLNKSLMDYESIMLGLISLHQEMRVQNQIAQEIYDNFYAEKFCEIKLQQTSLGKSAQFTAAREIELVVRKTHLKELAKLKADIIKTENKYNMINHLISAWEKYAFILNTLSKNSQAEANAAGVASKHEKEFGDE